MNVRKNGDENEHAGVKHEDVEYEHEDVEYENDQNDDENEHVHFEHENDNCEHEDVEGEHEDVGNEHENVDDEHEDVNNEHEHIDDNHVYNNIHKLIRFDNSDLGCVVERTGNVKIDLDFTDSDDDDDDDIDDIDNICDDHCADYKKKIGHNKETMTENSDSCVPDDIRSTKMKIEVDSNNESSNRSKNQTRNIPKVDNPHVSSDTRISHSGTNSGGPQYTEQARNEKEQQTRKQCVDKVHRVLVEWCNAETKKYLANSFRNKEIESGLFDDIKGSDEAIEETKDSAKRVMLPSIDSKSQMAIRGKIVSEKLTKA
jgi:hypothetical protein